MDAEVVVVGAGIVGLATARAVQRRRPGAPVVVLDKEPRVAAHQSGHSSGVIHAGVYYRPGSLKARLCRVGRAQLVDYCRERGIAYDVCGKLVVAVTEAELPALAELERRCAANGLAVERLSPAGIADVEPHASGVAALRVRATGVVDYVAVCEALRADVEAAGGEVRTGVTLLGGAVTDRDVRLETGAGAMRAAAVVNCAGLHADVVAGRLGEHPATRIVPFRGEYYALRPERDDLVRALIYPVPDPRLPFLGVHATRGIHGEVHLGPNAVLALAREGYSWRDVDPRELAALAGFPGLWRLGRQYWRSGAGEVHRSLRKAAFTRALQRLLPEVAAEDLVPAGAGVRAQAVTRGGALVDDFAFEQRGPRALHVLNAPSPAATSSLAIGDVIAARLLGGD